MFFVLSKENFHHEELHRSQEKSSDSENLRKIVSLDSFVKYCIHFVCIIASFCPNYNDCARRREQLMAKRYDVYVSVMNHGRMCDEFLWENTMEESNFTSKMQLVQSGS